MQWKRSSECILSDRRDPECGGDCLGRFVGVCYGTPNFEILVRVIGMRPKELPECEVRLRMVSEWQLPVKVFLEPLVDKHHSSATSSFAIALTNSSSYCGG